MSRANVVAKKSRTAGRFGWEIESALKDETALRSLKQGASIAKAAATSGWSIDTLRRHGVIRRYREWLAKRSKSQDPPSPERR